MLAYREEGRFKSELSVSKKFETMYVGRTFKHRPAKTCFDGQLNLGT